MQDALVSSRQTPSGPPPDPIFISTPATLGSALQALPDLFHVRKDQNAPTHLLVENATAGNAAYADLKVKNNLGNFAQFGLYSSSTTNAGAIASGNAFTYTTSPAMAIVADNAGGVIKFATGGVNERLRIDANGNVGIGTTLPLQKLQLGSNTSTPTVTPDAFSLGGTYSSTAGANSKLRLFDNNAGTVYGLGVSSAQFDFMTPAGTRYVWSVNGVEKMRLSDIGSITVAGDIEATGTIKAKYQDVAEWVPSTQELSAGTVVVLDHERSNHVVASSQTYDTRVAGVVSAQPGVILGEGGTGKLMVATTGRVRVKVDATRTPIRVGDLLVTGEGEGLAMKSMPIDLSGTPIHRPGTIIGKALEPLEKGTGEILVLLSLQ